MYRQTRFSLFFLTIFFVFSHTLLFHFHASPIHFSERRRPPIPTRCNLLKFHHPILIFITVTITATTAVTHCHPCLPSRRASVCTDVLRSTHTDIHVCVALARDVHTRASHRPPDASLVVCRIAAETPSPSHWPVLARDWTRGKKDDSRAMYLLCAGRPRDRYIYM